MAQDSSRCRFLGNPLPAGVIPWDAGQMPSQFVAFAAARPPGERVLAPGCGSGYEVRGLAEHGAKGAGGGFQRGGGGARARGAGRARRLRARGRFFQLDDAPFDWLYERALLCALPPKTWDDWAAQTARLVRPGGVLAGIFYCRHAQGPAVWHQRGALGRAVGRAFHPGKPQPASDSLPVFAGREHWMVWRRR